MLHGRDPFHGIVTRFFDRPREGRRGGFETYVSLRDAARQLDRMRNIDPLVARCKVDGQVATFHKEATFESGTISTRSRRLSGR
jgi:hypothetical protein